MKTTRTEAAGRVNVKAMTLTAVCAAIICVIAPWQIPVGAVPITLATFAVYMISAVTGPIRAAAAVAIYILLGSVGVPVFAGFKGGFNAVAGVTGGYIIGYLPCAFIIGLLCSKISSGKTSKARFWVYPASMAVGTVLLYAVGTAWYCIAAGVELAPALAACVFPFIPLDIVKIAAASILCARIAPALDRIK